MDARITVKNKEIIHLNYDRDFGKIVITLAIGLFRREPRVQYLPDDGDFIGIWFTNPPTAAVMAVGRTRCVTYLTVILRDLNESGL